MERALYTRLRAEVLALKQRVALLVSGGIGSPSSHATSHQNGGADEISVNGLSGVLADLQTGTLPGSPATVGITIDGGGAAISTGVKGYVQVPYGMTITAARLLADQSGSIVIDVWKDTYANFPPVDADSITASAPPTLSSAQKSENTTLTGWATSISAGDILGFNVDSAAIVQRVTLQLSGTRT